MPDAGESIRAGDSLTDSGWVAGTLATNWAGSSTYVYSRLWGNIVEVRARVRRINTVKTVNTSGDVGNETVGTLGSSSHYPTGNPAHLASGIAGRVAFGHVAASGAVVLASCDPGGGNINTGDFVTLHGSYLVG